MPRVGKINIPLHLQIKKMKLNFSIIIILVAFYSSVAQNGTPKDYLSPQFHKGRREALRKKMPQNSVAVFFGNPIRNRSNDVDFVFHQDPNFYYLTGYKEPNCVLIIFSEFQTNKEGKKYNEILYVQEKDPKAEQWTGIRLGVEGAKKTLGFDMVLYGEKFLKSGIDFYSFSNVFFSDFKDDYRDTPKEVADTYKLVKSFKQQIGYKAKSELNNQTDNESSEIFGLTKSNIDIKTIDVYMASLREIKTKEELVLLIKAIRISAIAQRESMKAMEPEMSETEIQGIHEFVYKKYGCEYEGYPSIVGAGNNGCVLHYSENNKTYVDNDLVLMDLGAEYHGYTADVTRTIPANGTFSTEQKLIYDIVYDAQQAGIESVKIGNNFHDPHEAARIVITKGLIKLGIIQTPDDFRKYFPHGTSHHIGLDVHDPGLFTTIEKDMVLTVEPGIYIPKGSDCDKKWWGIAVRIEDDILVTENGPLNLSAEAPRKINEIEALMTKKSILNTFNLPDIK